MALTAQIYCLTTPVNRSRSSDDIDLASHCLPKACREEVLAVEQDPSTTLNRSSIDENDLDLLDVSSNQEKLNEGENKEENILDAFIRSSKIPKFNHVAFIKMTRTQEYLERDTFRAQEGLRFVPFAMKPDLKRDEDDEAFKTMKHSNDEPFCDEASGGVLNLQLYAVPTTCLMKRGMISEVAIEGIKFFLVDIGPWSSGHFPQRQSISRGDGLVFYGMVFSSFI
ncbi:unnamed protein product [Ilex paraguariensis]|uniref:Uncharacterized protein n=1 Tax=Ilex paraguariensis TaxID=185542 RepID=A0ABC8UYJ4_9AQUA